MQLLISVGSGAKWLRPFEMVNTLGSNGLLVFLRKMTVGALPVISLRRFMVFHRAKRSTS